MTEAPRCRVPMGPEDKGWRLGVDGQEVVEVMPPGCD